MGPILSLIEGGGGGGGGRGIRSELKTIESHTGAWKSLPGHPLICIAVYGIQDPVKLKETVSRH
jgi:hypothetical protein